ncbi:hypothetical protein M9H77_05088 [Catharanthus roseus]|uniref:Uncharacterized protein n=1 Tax=Catharanthus roseus TaxID=4058 RepID=A0ACC0CG21_CATRO|nr:hypothetical protein M9H77_05088 [Catharanthus roseus]
MTTKFISKLISHLVANDPEISVSNVIQEVQVLLQMAGTEVKIWKFEHVMSEKIQKRNIEDYIYLAKINLEKWTLLHDGGHRHEVMTTNISEGLNSVLKKARESYL